jgi:glycosyltransferase involved in cell wall biosynthesis
MLSFIICTYNREKYIYECLSRLAKNTEQDGWEIVLVNNNSTDNTAAECERFMADYKPKNYHYFMETQQGLSYARNRGITETKGEWLVFLDDDAMVETDYIVNLQEHLKRHPQAGAFGGQIEPFFEDCEPDWYSKWSMGFVSAINRGEKVHVFPANKFPIGANMGIRRKVIEQVGMFNTELGRTGDNLLAGEEKDLFNRIREAGYEILYFPNIGVKHCIPSRRTTYEFVERLAYGVGVSERLRTKKIGVGTYAKRLFMEMIKWGGTLVLWCQYTIQGHHSKGDILVHFRYQVTRGLIN